jgi:hypothetical protein
VEEIEMSAIKIELNKRENLEALLETIETAIHYAVSVDADWEVYAEKLRAMRFETLRRLEDLPATIKREE